MSTKTTIAKARRLFESGQLDEARDLLLAAGYENSFDPAAQKEYERLFPLPAPVAERLAGYSARLSDPDPKVRVKAAKEIAREACKVSSAKAEAWMRHPQTTAMLTALLSKPDAEVHENAVIALAEIARRYFRDRRALPALLPMLHSRRFLARAWACSALQAISGYEAFEPVLPLLANHHATVRAIAQLAIGGILIDGLPKASDRARLRDTLLELSESVKQDVRRHAAGMLGTIADPSTAEALAEWLNREKDREIKQKIKDSIARLGIAY